MTARDRTGGDVDPDDATERPPVHAEHVPVDAGRERADAEPDPDPDDGYEPL
jgi:hypothetical protein